MVFHLILIGVPLALLTLFLVLTGYERSRGRRLLLVGSRYRLDQKTERAAFVVEHVDWGAFLNDLTRASAERALHDIAHTSLIVVRAVERELTSIVRTLRARREPAALPAPDREESSRIATATAYLKKTMSRSRKLPVQEDTSDRAL